MLSLTVGPGELWDETNECFIQIPCCTLLLEHSLIAIEKWESQYERSFLSNNNEMSQSETLDYIRCMTINYAKVDPNAYLLLTKSDFEKINAYIERPMCATKFYKPPGSQNSNPRGDKVTAELIYYWMISYNIPIEFNKWHINRLLTLIEVFEKKNKSSGSMNTRDIINNNNAINRQRRAKNHSRG